MRIILLTILIVLIIESCNRDNKFLSKYYYSNPDKHQQLAYSLMNLVKEYQRNITIRVRYDMDTTIVFRQYFSELNSQLPIEFDRNFNRVDRFPGYTLDTKVPVMMLKEIKNGIYKTIFADSNSVFLGYTVYKQSKYEHGILIFLDSTKVIQENIIKRLTDNACIYKDIVP